jgi:hypothetical protein
VQVHALYALLDEYSVKVPDVDRAGYATLDSSYAALKALLEEVEGNKDEHIGSYSAELETGGWRKHGAVCRRHVAAGHAVMLWAVLHSKCSWCWFRRS